MSDVRLSTNLTYQLVFVGNEKIPVLIIDDFVENPEKLIDYASLNDENGDRFQCQKSDYYPGVRKSSAQNYQALIGRSLFSLLKSSLFLSNMEADKATLDHEASYLNVLMSAFSIATTKPEDLRPIQMLPHFDTPANNQLAMVHYLCNENHGGTSIYRHKKTGFERITEQRHDRYRQLLKNQAIAEKLHLNPTYIEGDTSLFKQIYSIEAKMNRAVLYPSNVLHSGNIRPSTGLCSVPESGRLTISSFLSLK